MLVNVITIKKARYQGEYKPPGSELEIDSDLAKRWQKLGFAKVRPDGESGKVGKSKKTKKPRKAKDKPAKNERPVERAVKEPHEKASSGSE